MQIAPNNSTDAERNTVQDVIDKCGLRSSLDESWIRVALSPTTPRVELPPLFWLLTDIHRSQVIAEALELLSKTNSISPVMKELQLRDGDQVRALVRELEIYRLLRTRHTSVTWKPKTQGKRPDLAVELAAKRVYIEVFTIGRPESERSEDKVYAQLNQRIDAIPGNPYRIYCSLRSALTLSDIDSCLTWLTETIESLKATGANTESVDYPQRGPRKIRFEFSRAEDNRGGWFATQHQARSMNTSARVKNRLLDKLDALQFPIGSLVGKGYVMVLDWAYSDHEAVLSAILGRSALQVELQNSVPIARAVRQQDGVAHDPVRGRLLADEIDFVATFTTRGRALDGQPEIVLNGAPGKMTHAEVESLFLPYSAP